MNLNDSVIFTGHVTNEELLALYNNASVFAYPSVYEGFGLPLLEAMACGCPVVSSNTSSIPEVCGKAALLVDPKDPGAISEAILNIINNGRLRDELIREGLERVKLFSWKEAADRTHKIYNTL
jgi:glycosyltransferase involved in cell wall biosynthesis